MKTPMTPGEILLEDHPKPVGIWSPRRPISPSLGSQNAPGRASGASPRSINEIVLGRRAITPETPLKPGNFLKQSPPFRFNLPTSYGCRG